METNKIPISIATSAYNEERNIKQMLESVCRQQGASFTIKEILVISDGSIDKTVMMAKSVKNNNIKIFNDEQRKGKPARIAELLEKFTGDYLVLLDADLVVNDSDVIEKLMAKFFSDRKLGLVAAHLHPLPPKTFIEAAINNYRYAREALEKEYSFNNSVYGAHGCLVYSRKFGKSLKMPSDIINDDTYSYFSCIAQGYKFAHVKDAIILYRSPQTIKDYISQATRHLAGALQNQKRFGESVVIKWRKVPLTVNIKLILYQLLKNPAGYITLKLITLYCIYKSRRLAGKITTQWQHITSSKTC